MSCTHGSSNAPWVPHANASLSPREGRCKPSLPSRVTQAPEVEWLWVLGGVEVVIHARSAGYAAFFGFADACGVRTLEWAMPLTATATPAACTCRPLRGP